MERALAVLDQFPFGVRAVAMVAGVEFRGAEGHAGPFAAEKAQMLGQRLVALNFRLVVPSGFSERRGASATAQVEGEMVQHGAGGRDHGPAPVPFESPALHDPLPQRTPRPARSPPSMQWSDPVMKPARSEARKAMRSATSSGSPILPIGCAAPKR